MLARIEATEGLAKGFIKWYETWQGKITFSQQAILQLNEIFKENK
jgi:hypothetical protein